MTIINRFAYRVRYADTDKMQYMYNGNYLRLFEIGRTEMLREIELPYVQLEAAGVLLPVLEAHVKFHSPAFYDDLLCIESSFTPEYAATIEMRYRILRSDDLIASGSTRHSFVDALNRKPVRPPRLFVEAVHKYLSNQTHQKER